METIKDVVDFQLSPHVKCPDCGANTYPPYYDPRINEFYSGFYCEFCAMLWEWDEKNKQFKKDPC